MKITNEQLMEIDRCIHRLILLSAMRMEPSDAALIAGYAQTITAATEYLHLVRQHYQVVAALPESTPAAKAAH